MKLKLSRFCLPTGAASLVASAAFSVHAGHDLIKTLEDKGYLTAAEAAELYAKHGSGAKKGSKVTTKGGFKLSSRDGKYTVKVGGRIMYDYNRAELNGVADEDQFDSRRGRLYLHGTLLSDWEYRTQFNIIASSSGTPDHLYIRYKGFDIGDVTIGREKNPFGLEWQTSSKDISFLERTGISEAYMGGFVEGVSFKGGSKDFTYKIAAHSVDLDGQFDADDVEVDVMKGEFVNAPEQDLEDFGYGARFTYAPINEGGSLVHLGLGYRAVEGGNNVTGIELATVIGAFHAQAEFFDAETEVNIDADGYYIQLGYVLTGQSRPYKAGAFKRIKPSGKRGAVELVARYEDGDGDFDDIELGGDMATSYGVGVNWYVNNFIRLGLNYNEGESDTSDDEGEEWRARFQVAF